MTALIDHAFVKMNGLGNEILVLDLRGEKIEVSAAEARAIHRGQGLAYDQLMVLHDARTSGTDAYVRIYNNDGTASGACGNGTRCVAYVLLRDTTRTSLVVQTAAGLLACRKLSETSFSVDMGPPRLAWNEIPLREAVTDTNHLDLTSADGRLADPAVVNMGNPHAIFFVPDAGAFDLAAIGPPLEHHPIFPEKANISLAQVLTRDHLLLRVWERGVGVTQACGSAACAALVAAARRGLTDRKATVSLPGGDLTVEWRDDDHVIMSGPVELEFESRFPATLFDTAQA